MCFSRSVERLLSVLAVGLFLSAGASPFVDRAAGAAAPESTTAAPATPETPETPTPPEGADTATIRVILKGDDSGDMVRVGQSLTINADEIVTGDAVVVGGNLDIYGKVAGDAVVVGGTLHVHSGGRVAGDAVAVGGTVVRDTGAAVDGKHVSIGAGVDKLLPWGWYHKQASVAEGLAQALVEGLVRMVLGFLAILVFVDLFGARTERIRRRLEEDPFRSGLVGFLSMILIPIAVIVLVISCLGILLLPVLGFLIVAAIAWGLAVSSLVTGRTLGIRLFPGERADRWHALLGLVILYAANFAGSLLLSFGGPIRFLGWTLLIAGKTILVFAVLLGFGAVAWTRFGRKGKEEVVQEAAPPASPAGGPNI
jgi:hypothetical protein